MTRNRQIVILLVLALAVMLLSQPVMAQQIGQIKNATGQVHIIRGGEKIQAKIGDLLENKDAISTGEDGTVGITFIDNSRFSMGPNSDLELKNFRFDPSTHEGEFHSKINRGTVLILSGQIAKHSPEAMKVKTPTSILGVRGTKLVVKVDE